MASIIADEGGACAVRGALAVTLRASRVLGLAPLRPARAQASGGGAWAFTTTPRLVICNYLLFLTIISVIIVTLQHLFSQDWMTHQNSKFASVEIFVWTIEIARVSSVLLAGMVGVRARMTAIMNSLNAIEKVHLKYKSDRLFKTLDRKEKMFLGLTMSYAIFGIGHALYYLRIDLGYGIKTHELMSVLTWNRLLLFAMLALIEAQFTLTALRVNCALRAVNDAIGGLLYFTDLHNSELSASYSIHVKSINAAVDCLKIEKQLNNKVPMVNMDIGESIRHVTMAYESIQKAVSELNEGFGFTMFTIYSFFLVYMTFAPYFIVIFIIEYNKGALLMIGKTFELLMYMGFMWWGVQPGHEIEQEVQRTRRAVSELFSRAPSSGERALFQLKLFFQQLELGEPCYAPMGVFTLRRPLISAIVATTVTFTVVLLQIQGLNI